jgi:cell division protein FtsB
MKKIVFISICIVSVFIINGFVHSILNLWQKQTLISQAQIELQKKEREHKALQKQLGMVKTNAFVEETARNELFLGKPGESVVIVPRELLSPTPTPKPQKEAPTSHWAQWLRIILNPSS